MKRIGLLVVLTAGLISVSGCVHPSRPSYAERFLMAPAESSWEPLRVSGMIAPGIISVWRELEEETLFSIFRIEWCPDGKLLPEQVAYLAEYMFFERIFYPLQGQVGIGDSLANSRERLNRLVNGRLYTEGFDVQVDVEVIGVELVNERGDTLFTWGRKK